MKVVLNNIFNRYYNFQKYIKPNALFINNKKIQLYCNKLMHSLYCFYHYNIISTRLLSILLEWYQKTKNDVFKDIIGYVKKDGCYSQLNSTFIFKIK